MPTEILDYLPFAADGFISLLLLAGTFAGVCLVRGAARHFQRVAHEQGAALASCGLTGQLAAHRLLAICGLQDVAVVRSSRSLYQPRKRQVHLNAQTFDSPSLAAITTAAHEVGHAQQFAAGILICRLRQAIVPICYTLIGVAVLAPFVVYLGDGNPVTARMGWILLLLGIVVIVLQVPIHLPLEYDASRRARILVTEAGLLATDEQRGFDAILKAAWLTHASVQVQRFLIIGVAALVLCLSPTFIGSSAREQASHIAAVEAARQQRIREAARLEYARRLPRLPAAGEPNQIVTVDWFTLLLPNLIGIVPCALILFGLHRFNAVIHRPKSPSKRAIERNNAAMLLFSKGECRQALGELNEALRLDPQLAAAYYNRGMVHRRLGNLEASVEDFEAHLRIFSSNPHSLAARAEAHALAGDFDRAFDEFAEALRRAPQNASLRARRGLVHAQRKDFDLALADFDAASALDAREPLAHQGRGLVCMARGELDRAIAELDRAIALDGRNVSVRTLRGQVSLAKDDYDRAIGDFTEALKLDVRQPAALRDRGLAWFFKKDWKRAIADSSEAIRLDRADATAHNNRGAARWQVGDYEKAAADLREAIRLNPDLPNPYKHLAWLQGNLSPSGIPRRRRGRRQRASSA